MGKEKQPKGTTKPQQNAEKLADKLVTFRTFSQEEVKALIIRAYRSGWRDSLLDVITED